MKNVVVFFLIIFSVHYMSADDLMNAIHDSDIDKVHVVLAQYRDVRGKFVKYLDAAEQIIRLRRDQITNNAFTWEYYPPERIEQLKAMSYYSKIGLIVSACLPIIAFNETTVVIGGMGVTASLVVLLESAIVLSLAKTKDIHQWHKDAITIKGLLYDHYEGIKS